MHSPLPDSSALEAGIVEDQLPSRLSRVQDNVRNLLRTSVFGSVASSPTHPRHSLAAERASALPSPLYFRPRVVDEVLPSPGSDSSASTGATTTTPRSLEGVESIVAPAAVYDHHATNHQSTMYNSRAVLALDHPDLSDPSLPFFEHQKARRKQQKCWSRSRHGGSRRPGAKRAAGAQGLVCFLAALLLGALVATYLAVALASTNDITPTFHILFVLAILLATIIFAHSTVRLCVKAGKHSRSRALLIDVSRNGQVRRRHHHHHHHHHRGGHRHQRPRQIPVVSADVEAYVPPTPIQVHVGLDDARADVSTAQPVTASPQPSSPPNDWSKEVHTVTNPPPAYGRWRGSVRVNPDLLHWQAVPSPTESHAPALPSPTYEEATATRQTESPPSYATRDSPARRRAMAEARAGGIGQEAVEPEMVEVGGGAGRVGLAM